MHHPIKKRNFTDEFYDTFHKTKLIRRRGQKWNVY